MARRRSSLLAVLVVVIAALDSVASSVVSTATKGDDQELWDVIDYILYICTVITVTDNLCQSLPISAGYNTTVHGRPVSHLVFLSLVNGNQTSLAS